MLLGSPRVDLQDVAVYQSAGKQVQGIAAEYRTICVSQTREWQGKAADAYRAAAKRHAGGLETLSKVGPGHRRVRSRARASSSADGPQDDHGPDQPRPSPTWS